MGRPKKNVSEAIIKQYNLELQLANNSSKSFFKNKSSKNTSCLMCQKRKTKCIKTTNKNSCLNCLKSVIKCVQPDILDINGNGLTTIIDDDSKVQYIKFLESKLSSLEESITELDDLANLSNNNPSQTTFNFSKHEKFHKKIQKYKKVSGFLQKSGNDYDAIVNKLYTDVKNYESSDSRVYLKVNGSGKQQLNAYENFNEEDAERDYNSSNFASNLFNRTLPPLFKRSSPVSPLLKKESFSDTLNIQSFNSQILGSIDFSKCILAKYNLADFLSYDPAFSFDEALACQFLEIYFTRLQFKYPLLAKDEVFAFHSYYTQLNGQLINGSSTKGDNSFLYTFFQKYDLINLSNAWENKGNAKDYHYCCSRIWLIFAISSCLHKTSGKYRGLPPNRYFSTAIRHLAKCQDNLNPWEKVEILSLSLQYIIRTDRDSMELYIILNDIIEISLNVLRLHDLSDCQNDIKLKNKKIRLFWSVYLLERMICNAVEKPFLINSEIIPTNYPLFNIEIFEKGILTDKSVDNRTPDKRVHFINQVVKLRILESSFTADLDLMNWQNKKTEVLDNQFSNTSNTYGHIAVETRRLELNKMEMHFNNLCEWRSNCKIKQLKAFEAETLKLYYYRAVRLLIQPYLDLLKPHNKFFRECQAAAGQICQLYKIFHQKTVFGHSTSAVHTVFSAGLTLIYCLWLARNHDDLRRKKLGDSAKHTRPTLTGTLIASFDDLRACSVSLYVMAERSRFAVIYRDTFDQLMQCTIGNLIERSGPNSSELILAKANFTNKIAKLKGFKNANENATEAIDEDDDEEEVNGKQNEGNMEEEEDDDEEEEESKNTMGYLDGASNSEFARAGIPAAINRNFGLKQEMEHSRFLQNIQVDTDEQKEFKRLRGVLKKTMIPKPLSNLLDAYDSEKKLNDTVKSKETKRLLFSLPLSSNSKLKQNFEYTESNRLKDQENKNRLVSALTDKNDESSSSSFGSPKYFVQKPLQNPTEEEWKNLGMKALIKQQAGQQSLQAYLTGVPATIDNDIIENADSWDFTLNANNSNNALFEMHKGHKLTNNSSSPSFTFLQEYNGSGSIENTNINSLWTGQSQDGKKNTLEMKMSNSQMLKSFDWINNSQIKKGSPTKFQIFDHLNTYQNVNGSSANPISNSGSIRDATMGVNGNMAKTMSNHGSINNDHINNPINQSTVQHMISNISQWTSAGFEDLFFADSLLHHNSNRNNEDNKQ
ncbi:hypothetical protein QEN19_000425 [Hanseniaspora menglaensis]